MEESKDLITGYKIFRSLVYVSLVLCWISGAASSWTCTEG